ncbi:hypothetical protein HMPREF0321_2033, partial [Dermacoccus sp. Ellin185]
MLPGRRAPGAKWVEPSGGGGDTLLRAPDGPARPTMARPRAPVRSRFGRMTSLANIRQERHFFLPRRQAAVMPHQSSTDVPSGAPGTPADALGAPSDAPGTIGGGTPAD